MVAIVSNKREAILKAVEDMYTEVANRPAHPFHFPTGRRAAELVGYPPAELDALPPAAVESFAGVGYPFAAGVIRAGDTVLDIGSGSGTDALLAARRAGLKGKYMPWISPRRCARNWRRTSQTRAPPTSRFLPAMPSRSRCRINRWTRSRATVC